MGDGQRGGRGAADPERASRHVPLSREQREGTALCLSGGGYRAALFHLGGLRRLNELGILGHVDVISSVSGGSIVSGAVARYVSAWPHPGERIEDFDRVLARPLKRFTARNIRTWPILSRALPWNWRARAVDSLARTYQRRLIPSRLSELADRPKFVFCATDMAFGVNWVFDSGSFHPGRRRVGDYLAGYLKEFPDWPVAKAVAASSCFPPVFNPMRLHLEPEDLKRPKEYLKDDWADLVGDISLSDGGVYDNMGLEPVWKRARTVLVSDGGAVFKAQRDSGLLWRVNRYASVAGRQGGAMRKRWLISNFLSDAMDGTYWGLGSVAGHYPRGGGPRGYPEKLIDEVISNVRTDLDSFSEAEQAVLENHGYLLADAAARSHLPALIDQGAPMIKPPHEEWLNEAKVRDALAKSHKRKALGRW